MGRLLAMRISWRLEFACGVLRFALEPLMYDRHFVSALRWIHRLPVFLIVFTNFCFFHNGLSVRILIWCFYKLEIRDRGCFNPLLHGQRTSDEANIISTIALERPMIDRHFGSA